MKTTFSLFLLVVVCATGVYAQSMAGYGAVTGTVRDANGEGIPDSAVLLSNESMGVRRSIMSTDDGTFDAPSLVPAKGYSLKVTRKGFVDWKSTVFDVSTGQTLNFTVMMQAEGGSVPEVDAARALAPVDDTRVGVSTLIGRAQIDGLPTSDSRLDELALLAPTVSTGGGLGLMAFQGMPFYNAFLIDGISVVKNYSFVDRIGIANQVPQDALEEVQVLVSDASGEFTRSMGGTVNAVTRSGGNSFHGAGYGYFAKPTLSAVERYAMGRTLFQKQDQYGGSVGGPVYPGKVFFFLNAEVLEGNFRRSVDELQDDNHHMRRRHQIHPAANERGYGVVRTLGKRPGEDRLPPQRAQYVRGGGQRHECALPAARERRQRGPRRRTAGPGQFQGGCPLRKGLLDHRAE
jgi:hypothetical protein